MDALHWSLFGGCVVALAAWLVEAWKARGERKGHNLEQDRLRRRAVEAEHLAESRLRRLRGAANYLSGDEL